MNEGAGAADQPLLEVEVQGRDVLQDGKTVDGDALAEHVIARGESIWVLALREYGVPIWLFRQYNPELDLHKLRPGVTVRFPVMVARVDS